MRRMTLQWLVALTGLWLCAWGTWGMAAGLSETWLGRWNRPAAADRPLQIVHGIPPGRATLEGMRYYQDRGLGGIVCNVAFVDYLRSEEHWKTLAAGVEACRGLGLVVWLYDEEGYPSGAAGGLVLAEDRTLEALELACDKSRPEPLFLRRAYEHAHAANNFHAARRYPNLLEPRATSSFLAKTHEVYWRRLAPHFGRSIEAVFTDEPSLMAVGLGRLPESVRKGVRVVDPVDPTVPSLPSVPWCDDLPARYQERFGEDLMKQRASLFGGDGPEDRKVRRQFWSLIAELMAARYFGAIQQWCAGHRIASSGHVLWEEGLIHHVPLMGNALACLERMDIPGLDMLSSDPAVAAHGGWLTAALPASAAMLHDRRRVMTEVSDFSEKIAGGGPAGLGVMRAAAAWQAAWGVTEFTLYYRMEDRSAEDSRAYGDFVGRLSAILKPARLDRPVLLYYPIHDLWEEYLPVAGPLAIGSQSARAQRIVGSFERLGRLMQTGQIQFALVDHAGLSAAAVEPGGALAIGSCRFTALVLPEDVSLPEPAAKTAAQFQQAGGRVLRDGQDGKPLDAAALARELAPPCRLSPASETLALGRFVRDGRRVLLVVNTSTAPYRGQLLIDPVGKWLQLDPATGAVRSAPQDAQGRVELSLAGHETALVVEADDKSPLPLGIGIYRSQKHREKVDWQAGEEGRVGGLRSVENPTTSRSPRFLAADQLPSVQDLCRYQCPLGEG